jgi:hypothetical protein
MTRRHAAAILGVGWYLLVPPALMPRFPGEHEPDLNAPISQWEQLGQFDDASQCEHERSNLGLQLADPKTLADEMQQRSWYGDYARKRLDASKCIEMDDPRLQGKE